MVVVTWNTMVEGPRWWLMAGLGGGVVGHRGRATSGEMTDTMSDIGKKYHIMEGVVLKIYLAMRTQ